MSHSSRIPRSVTSSGAARCGATLLLGALTLLPASGCEDSSTGGGQPNTGGELTWPVAKDDYASTLAEAHCSSIAECCRSGGFAFDQADCVRNARALFTALVDDMSSQPNRIYDDKAAGRCVAALRARNVACDDRAIEEALEDGCRRVFAGVLPLGADCTKGSECAEGQGQDVYCNEGKCTLSDSPFSQPHGAKGDVCSGSCDGESGRGSSCSNRPGGEGMACWRGDGLYCSYATGQCEAVAAVGQACGSSSGGGVCAIGARCQDGVCVAAADGEPCRASAYGDCPAESTCDFESWTCRALKANGDVCSLYTECVSLECQNGRCTDFTVASGPACSGLFKD